MFKYVLDKQKQSFKNTFYIHIYTIYKYISQKKHKQTSYRDCIKEKNLQFRCKIWYLKL